MSPVASITGPATSVLSKHQIAAALVRLGTLERKPAYCGFERSC